MLRTKVFRGEDMKVLDEATGRVSAVVSTEKVDRDGDVIRAEGWGLSNFLKHPVLLVNHDYYSIRSQIGEWESMEIKGNKMQGIARFYIGRGNADADWAFELAKEKSLAFSVGFIPDMDKAAPLNTEDKFGINGMEFKGQELLEVSAVTIPSNPDALQRVVKTPSIHPVIAEIAEERLATEEPELETKPDSNISALLERLEALEERVTEQVFVTTAPLPVPEEVETPEQEEPEEIQEPQDSLEFDPYAVAIAAAGEALEEMEDEIP